MDRSGRSVWETRPPRPHAHVMEVASRGMVGLAQTLIQEGMSVSTTGRSSEHLRRTGIRIDRGDRPRRLARTTRLLVHGPDVGRLHPLRLAALRRGVRQTTPTEWLREAMRTRFGVAVTGDRAASVAAAMIGWMLTDSGHDPTVVLSRPSPQLGGWSRVGRGPHLIAEWPEGPEGLERATARLMVRLDETEDGLRDSRIAPAEGLYRVLATMPAGAEALVLGDPGSIGKDEDGPEAPAGRVEWLALRLDADGWGAEVREGAAGDRLRVFHRGRFVTELRMPILGRHHRLGALAAVAVGSRLGLSVATIREGLEGFRGLARDFEVRGSVRGVTLIDDAAEHPGAVQHVLEFARRVFGRRRLWAVLTVPGAAAPEAIEGYAAALSGADRVRIVPAEGVGAAVSGAWARGLDAAGVPARGAADLAEALGELDRELEPGDVLMTLGAGDVGMIADAFIRRRPRDRPGR